MRSPLLIGIVFAMAVTWGASLRAQAQESEPANQAVAELKTGYALRRAGKCADALPHLVESMRLAPALKALINVADCEEQVGHLVDAEQHWQRARDLAEAEATAAMREEVLSRLRDLEDRLPRITVVVADGAPPTSQVTRDGVTLPSASLGVSLPCDPGDHAFGVSAEGRLARIFTVTVAEREQKTIVVAPGPEPAEPAAPPFPLAGDPLDRPISRSVDGKVALKQQRSGPPPLGYAAIAAGAVGAWALGLGAAEWDSAQNAHAQALTVCAAACARSTAAQDFQDHARAAAVRATASFVVGAVLGVASLTLGLVSLGPRSPDGPAGATRRIHDASVALVWQRGAGGLTLEGGW